MAEVYIDYAGDKATIRLMQYTDDTWTDEYLVSEFVTTKAKADNAVAELVGDRYIHDEFDLSEDYFNALQDYCNTK